MKKEILAIAAACVMALAIIFAVKKFLVLGGTIRTDRDMVLFLELGVVLLVFSAFVGNEVIRGMRNIIGMMSTPPEEAMRMDIKGVLILFGAVIASLSIYYAFTTLLSARELGARAQQFVHGETLIGIADYTAVYRSLAIAILS